MTARTTSRPVASIFIRFRPAARWVSSSTGRLMRVPPQLLPGLAGMKVSKMKSMPLLVLVQVRLRRPIGVPMAGTVHVI